MTKELRQPEQTTERGLIVICGWSLNCRHYLSEAYTCNRESEEGRSKYCASYKKLDKMGEKAPCYKDWRFTRT